MSDNKYYTPEFFELHPGFECDISIVEAKSPKEQSSEWKAMAIGDGSKESDLFTGELLNDYKSVAENLKHFIRVKYLDTKDIRSFGFKLKKHEGKFKLYFVLRHYVMIVHKNFYVTIWAYPPITPEGEETKEVDIFRGWIKNKSQLNNILTYTGIITNPKSKTTTS